MDTMSDNSKWNYKNRVSKKNTPLARTLRACMMSQAQLARLLHKDSRTINRWVAGKISKESERLMQLVIEAYAITKRDELNRNSNKYIDEYSSNAKENKEEVKGTT